MFDTSIESMLGDLFGTSSKHSMGIESSLFMGIESDDGDEDDKKGEPTVIEGTDKTVDLEEDKSVIKDAEDDEENLPTDAEGKPTDAVDPTLTDKTEEVTGECYRLSAECAVMNVAMFAAEHFQSTEGEGWDKFKATMKKIWIKVRDFALTILRRINLLIAGDLKGYQKWAAANNYQGFYGSSKATVNAKVPVTTFSKVEEAINAISGTYNGCVDLAKEALSTGKSTWKDEIDKEFAGVAIDTLTKLYYGEKPTTKAVTPAEFKSASGFGWDDLKNPNLKGMIVSATNAVKGTKILLAGVDRAKEMDADAKAVVRKTSTYGTAYVNATFWAMNQKLSGIRTVRALAGKVVGESTKKKAKDKK